MITKCYLFCLNDTLMILLYLILLIYSIFQKCVLLLLILILYNNLNIIHIQFYYYKKYFINIFNI